MLISQWTLCRLYDQMTPPIRKKKIKRKKDKPNKEEGEERLKKREGEKKNEKKED